MRPDLSLGTVGHNVVLPRLTSHHEIHQAKPDPVRQMTPGPPVRTKGGLNFDGLTVEGWWPPDANGAVGSSQYVQWVNFKFAVYDKSTGALLAGPLAGNALWANLGGACAYFNSGDPIVQYDKLAGRWVLAQPVFTPPSYAYCIAVSQTSDATGAYNLYEFPILPFPDYPKLGIWSDGYYATFNMFRGFTFLGSFACAFDRAKMLAGRSATMLCFNSRYDSLLPSDIDGTIPPPAGEPAFFVNFGSNSLNFWKFHVDFANSKNSTFIGPTNVAVAPFTEVCGGGFCIPQGGTSQKLESLADRLMYRFTYRNFGDHESLLVNHSVTADSAAGVRWYEIRNPNIKPTIFQQGTFAPADGHYRWMGSIAMDRSGDIAIGYSKSSSTMSPAIFYTGRVPTDALGMMESETQIIAGGSSQPDVSRWGDYSSMSLDPIDDCTFWYTTEYVQSVSSPGPSTRIASFKFKACGKASGPDFSVGVSPSSQSVAQGESASYNVTVDGIKGYKRLVNLSASGLPAGASAEFDPSSVTGSGLSTMSINVESGTSTGTFLVTMTGTEVANGLEHSAQVILVVTAPRPPQVP
ncbi:MAG TPA: hypothetical protein VG028_21795 [Terriglobia bacterium]|nr:hypothetical protein [Terriglobia bacterium]